MLVVPQLGPRFVGRPCPHLTAAESIAYLGKTSLLPYVQRGNIAAWDGDGQAWTLGARMRQMAFLRRIHSVVRHDVVALVATYLVGTWISKHDIFEKP